MTVCFIAYLDVVLSRKMLNRTFASIAKTIYVAHLVCLIPMTGYTSLSSMMVTCSELSLRGATMVEGEERNFQFLVH